MSNWVETMDVFDDPLEALPFGWVFRSIIEDGEKHQFGLPWGDLSVAQLEYVELRADLRGRRVMARRARSEVRRRVERAASVAAKFPSKK